MYIYIKLLRRSFPGFCRKYVLTYTKGLQICFYFHCSINFNSFYGRRQYNLTLYCCKVIYEIPSNKVFDQYEIYQLNFVPIPFNFTQSWQTYLDIQHNYTTNVIRMIYDLTHLLYYLIRRAIDLNLLVVIWNKYSILQTVMSMNGVWL